VKIEVPRGWGLGRSVPLPNRLGDLRVCRELPQRGSGRNPGCQRIFGIFEAHGTLLVERTVLLRHNKASFSRKNPLGRRLGECPLPPSFGYAPAQCNMATNDCVWKSHATDISATQWWRRRWWIDDDDEIQLCGTVKPNIVAYRLSVMSIRLRNHTLPPSV